MATMTMEVAARPIPTLHVSRELVVYATYLAMDTADVERLVAEAIDENPALVRADRPSCGRCGSHDVDHRCNLVDASGAQTSWRDIDDRGPRRKDDAGLDPVAHTTLADELIGDARLLLPPDLRRLVEEVVGDLDDDGYLRVGLDQLATSLGVPVGDIQTVLDALRTVGGPAVGAGSVREALALQLAAMDLSDRLALLAREIVGEHLEDLEAGRLTAIARAVGAPRDDVFAAREFIRRVLRPHPVTGLRLPASADPPRHVPDIVIHERDDGSGFEIEVEPGAWTDVRVDPLFAAVAVGHVHGTTQAERTHADGLVSRAQALVNRLRDRRDTLRRIAVHAIERQRDFVRFGPTFLVPLTRTQVATALGVHESTVSRAVAHRTVRLPDGRIVPFAKFFGHGAIVEDALRRLIQAEIRPLSDAALASGLRDAGYRVARRTVAKYRRRLGLPPAADRAPGEATFA
jgi:RNA polymerase sigma-54 factor